MGTITTPRYLIGELSGGLFLSRYSRTSSLSMAMNSSNGTLGINTGSPGTITRVVNVNDGELGARCMSSTYLAINGSASSAATTLDVRRCLCMRDPTHVPGRNRLKLPAAV